MKKILIIFLSLYFSFLSATAQLPGTILDCTFGKSTTSSVKQQIANIGFESEVNPNGTIFSSFINSNHPIGDSTPKVCGTWWAGSLFSFSGGVLSDIRLQNTYKNMDFAKTYYDIVRNYLNNNFAKYFWEASAPISKPGYKEIEGVYYNSDNLYYKLFYGESNGTPFLTLHIYYR